LFGPRPPAILSWVEALDPSDCARCHGLRWSLAMIGTAIGHYRVVEKIGAGGMGEVYRAEDVRLGRLVALKFLPEHLQKDETARKRFLREARSTAALEHPYICNVKEVDRTDDGRDFIVMEYVGGETLRHRIERAGPLPFDEALRIAAEVAEALAAAHARGIIHRDLKPDNIMLAPQGHAKVMDFGLAKRVEGAIEPDQSVTSVVTQSGSVLGTPAYMSPEQLQGSPMDFRSDLFSFGIVLYEMLSGVHPFRRSTALATMASILTEDQGPLSRHLGDRAAPLEAMVRRLLAKERAERPSSTDEIARELRDLAGKAPGSHLVSVLRGRRAIFVGMVSAAAAIVALAGWWISSPGDASRTSPLMRAVAVMPFENISGDPGEDYFVKGVTEELATSLAKLGALTVIAPAAVEPYADKGMSQGEIAGKLGVRGLISGSVLREGTHIRVNARLVEAETGQYLWTETYQRDLTTIFALQAEVTQDIARQIRITLRPEERSAMAQAPSVDPEAYDLYLQGAVYWRTLTQEGLDTAERYFQRALEKDSTFALPYTGLARVWAGRGQTRVAPTDEVVAKGGAAARRALELDPGLAEAHAALAMILSWHAWDWEGAWPHWRRALEINPSDAETHAFYAHFLAIMGDREEAIPHGRRAVELNPVDALYRGLYAMTLFLGRRYEEAVAQADSALAVDPNQGLAKGARGEVLLVKVLLLGAPPGEIMDLQRRNSIGDPGRMAAFERGLAAGGFEGVELAMGDLMASRYGRPGFERVRARTIGEWYLQGGDAERALDWYERAVRDERDPNMPYVVRPGAKILRKLPRFADLLRDMHFPEDAIARNIALPD